ADKSGIPSIERIPPTARRVVPDVRSLHIDGKYDVGREHCRHEPAAECIRLACGHKLLQLQLRSFLLYDGLKPGESAVVIRESFQCRRDIRLGTAAYQPVKYGCIPRVQHDGTKKYVCIMLIRARVGKIGMHMIMCL